MNLQEFYPQYLSTVELSDLQDTDLTSIQDSQEINHWLEYVGFPSEWLDHITGVIVKINDGDLIAMWLTENYAPYLLNTPYHSLPYYLNYELNKRFKTLPYYWQYDNKEYYFKRGK